MKIAQVLSFCLMIGLSLTGCSRSFKFFDGASKSQPGQAETVISSISPSASATNVTLNPRFDITFSRELDLTVSDVELHSGSETGPLVNLVNFATTDNKTFSFVSSNLNYSTTYHLVVKAKSYNGFNFSGKTLSFETGGPAFWDYGTKYLTSYMVQIGGSYMDYDGRPVALIQNVSSGDMVSLVKYDGSQLIELGGAPVGTTSSVWHVALAVKYDDVNKVAIPYVLTVDSYWQTATVKRLINNQWEAVGTSGLTRTIQFMSSVDMIIDHEGNPLVVYAAGGNSDLYAEKLVNNAWVSVDGTSSSILALRAQYIRALSNSQGEIYIVGTNKVSSTPFVVHYDGTSWTSLPVTGLPSVSTTYLRAQLDNQENPVIFFRNSTNSTSVVARFDGSSWSTLGGASAGTNNGDTGSLNIAPNGSIFISFQSSVNSNSVGVIRKFDGASWTTVGGGAASEFATLGMSSCMGRDGSHYLIHAEYNMSDSSTMRRLRIRQGF